VNLTIIVSSSNQKLIRPINIFMHSSVLSPSFSKISSILQLSKQRMGFQQVVVMTCYLASSSNSVHGFFPSSSIRSKYTSANLTEKRSMFENAPFSSFVTKKEETTIVQQKKTKRFMSLMSEMDWTNFDFKRGDPIQVEVLSFGPMGASADIVGLGHNPDSLIPESDPALGGGIIFQREIGYFREARQNVDVVVGEVLPAYVETVRDDGRIDISLRQPGGKAKAESVSKLILEKLKASKDGILQLGDKSTPQAIATEFPGVSKGSFKKAISALYRQGLVQPDRDSLTLMKK